MTIFGTRPEAVKMTPVIAALGKSPHFEPITARALEGLDPAIVTLKPVAIVVQGDTTTTFVGALAGFSHQVPVGHLEA